MPNSGSYVSTFLIISPSDWVNDNVPGPVQVLPYQDSSHAPIGIRNLDTIRTWETQDRTHTAMQVIVHIGSEIWFYVTICETRLFTSISPVELAGHPVNRQTCWALQTGVHHHLKKPGHQRPEFSHSSYHAALSYILNLWALRAMFTNKDRYIIFGVIYIAEIDNNKRCVTDIDKSRP